MIYVFEAPVWLYSAAEGGAWRFITVPVDVSAGLKALGGPARGQRRGWGMIRVTVTIGQTRWRTSVFPDKTSGGFLLPLKAAVRKAENLGVGDVARVTLELET